VLTKPKKSVKQSRAQRTETIKFLTLDEAKRLFSVIDSKRDKAIFLLAYRHGLRASEVGLLRKADIDLKTLRADEVKALKAYLKTREDSLPYLFPSRRASPISRGMLDVLIKDYGEKAKIPGEKRHFHVLKHSIATHLLEKGAELRFLQDWLGHANIQNTVIYTSLVSSAREEKARQYFLELPQF